MMRLKRRANSQVNPKCGKTLSQGSNFLFIDLLMGLVPLVPVIAAAVRVQDEHRWELPPSRLCDRSP